ncbi:FtsX-like permease family protein [Ginsengibacter hankyongi]|uniref:FtsX-like permease family protein n=1 Tax=Ginsengibacter hankyongi TaxID=2607284 RepID=A0A5J5IGW0_9BACT|nr:FtsX-like permease family protein [Ginsengibacter hankyongi]KAA9039146.1 FtsX-like permease family protein [Ginsengibacter hankyongi]
MELSYKNIEPLIISGKNIFSKWLGYFGLGIGVLLLLFSMQMFINIQQLLKEKSPRKSGYDFISISKNITNENMGKDNSFTNEDLNKLKTYPAIEGLSPLISNQFRVRATAGDVIPFSTDLFLESIDKDFIDTVPPSFTWQPGQSVVPIIFSSDFLEMYNVFAPAQGLPQLSAKTISSINIILECSGPNGTLNFKGNIVALSDRINSLLVPKTFMNWSNLHLSGDTATRVSRVYIKTKDANDPQLISFLDQQNYHLNKDKVKFSRVKSILQNIVSALGIFGILVIVMALVLFSFYLQLMIAKSKDNLRLLLTLGYSPRWLTNSVAKTWLPVYLFIIIGALIITQLLHLLFLQFSFVDKEDLSFLLHWSVWLIAILLLALTVFINSGLVKKELNNII